MLRKYFQLCTEKTMEVINIGMMALANFRLHVFTADFLLLGLMEQKESSALNIIEGAGYNPIEIRDIVLEKIYQRINEMQQESDRSQKQQQIIATEDVGVAFEIALQEAKSNEDRYIGTDVLFMSLFDSRVGETAKILEESGLNYAKCREAFQQLRAGFKFEEKDSETRSSALREYAVDLTELAKKGELDPVIGRENEIQRVIEILSRRKKNNPVLIGEPGVGKTVIVDGLAQRISNAEVPKSLLNKKLLSLDLSELIAGAKMRGEFEERVKALRDEIIASKGQIILFIDEIHTAVVAGAGGGGMDASTMLKPALARGQLQCIGATTVEEYKKYIEADKALERRLQMVIVKEPTIEETVKILKGLRPRYEEFHKIRYNDDALDAAAKLSERYISDRFLPDKAIDLIDEAGARKYLDKEYIPPEIRKLEKHLAELQANRMEAFNDQDFAEAAAVQREIESFKEKLESEKSKWIQNIPPEQELVDEEDIARIVARWTGIPVARMVETEAEKLLHMEQNLHKRIIGQDQAISSVSDSIRRNRAGLKKKQRPIGSFIFLGPTGVGKTELAKALAEFLLDDENRLIRLDMSEFMERHEVSKLIGSPPGYVGYGEGGQLTEKIRRNPYSVILFDEIEKAHPDVFNMLLQILDDGRLTDAQGREVSFKNTVVIGTSNIGSHLIVDNKAALGFKTGQDPELTYEEVKKRVMNEVKKYFKPEFLNRIDDLIVFHQLTEDHIRHIVDLQIDRLNLDLAEQEIRVELTDTVKQKLAEEGYNPAFGARPLQRLVEKRIGNPLATKIINKDFSAGDTVIIDLVNQELQFIKKSKDQRVEEVKR